MMGFWVRAFVGVVLLAGCGRGQPFGEACESNGACASELCASSSRGFICTEACESDCDCPNVGPGFRCALDTGLCVEGDNSCEGGCIAQCAGLECGPDPVCGTSCGGCDDGNECTNDSCNGGRCNNEPEDRRIACDDDPIDPIQTRCEEGSAEAYSCAEVCRISMDDYNATIGCNASLQCVCSLFDDTCTSANTGARNCIVLGGVQGINFCLDLGGPFWAYRTCEDACVQSGFRSFTGECRANGGEDGEDVCICER